MIIDNFITKQISKFTDDEAKQFLILTHRYIMSSLVICYYINNQEEERKFKKMSEQYENDLKVAFAFLDLHVNEMFSETKSQKKQFKKIMEETKFYVAKELENFIISNYNTKLGIVKQLEIAHHYCLWFLRVLTKCEDDQNSTNLNN